MLFFRGHDSGLLIIADSFLKEIGLAFQTDVLHEVKGILRMIMILASQLAKEAIRNKFDVSEEEKGDCRTIDKYDG